MARRVRDKDIETREARLKLTARPKPYWRTIGRGLHLGYRKGKTGAVWVVRRYLGDEKYSVESIAIADDKEDANGVEILDFFQAQDAARSLRAPAVRHAGAYTVKDAVDAYVEYLDGRPSAFDTKKRLYAYAIPSFGDRPVAELEVDEIRNWHRSIAKHGARQRTAIGRPQNYAQLDADDPEAVRKRQVSANRCLSLLRAALNHAWYSDKVKCEKVWAKVKPFKGVDIPRARYLTVAEAQRLINASDTEFRILARAALETGARYQELARLRVKDFDPDAGTLHVRKSKTNRDKHIILTLDEGVPFFASLAAGRKGSHPLLGREWKPGQQDTPMKVACKRAGIEPPVPFHVLRHTYASLSVMNGTPLMVVAKNLGHVDTRMVEKHYGHLAAGFISDAIRAGAPRFGNVAGNVKAIR